MKKTNVSLENKRFLDSVKRAMPAAERAKSPMHNMAEKYAQLKPGAANPYIDPQGFQNEITIQETALNNELKRQEVEGPPAQRGRGGAGARRGQ